MMIKITQHCSMGCSHCLNDAKPNNIHMSMDMFGKALEFQRMYGPKILMITGGEPTEHPMFTKFCERLMSYCNTTGTYACITTNGIWLQERLDFLNYVQSKCDKIEFQITSVPGLYPTVIDINSEIFSSKYSRMISLCTDIPAMYPQGRALTNNYPYPHSKGPKCFNIRLACVQTYSLKSALMGMAIADKYCTPHIDVFGNIKVGESDLCPVCSHIEKDVEDIYEDIINFRCNGCSNVKDRVPQRLRTMIGE